MNAFVLALVVQAAVAPQQIAPVLEFPEPGLDDAAAYEGYRTRFYQDSHGNAFQIYINADSRVVHLWANAANESASFTVRDSAGRPADLSWSADEATLEAAGQGHTVTYGLTAEPVPIEIGGFLLGSMRLERDFQYQGGNRKPFDGPAFEQPELIELIANLERLGPDERQRHLALLDAGSVDELRDRLQPTVALSRSGETWTVRVAQPSFDGRNRMALELSGDRAEADAEVVGRTVSIRPRSGGPIHLIVSATTDAGALTPLERTDIFTEDFLRHYERVRAENERLQSATEAGDTADPERLLRFRRLERQVRGVELVSYEEKLMAGLPNFATYFGRDMLMTALMMDPIWTDAMSEHVIGSVLRKLSPSGEVSHEEALGGQAIRENAAAYNELLARYFEGGGAGEAPGADTTLAHARAILEDLQEVRENYRMMDDDFQFPVLVARYLTNPEISTERKREFLLEPADGAEGASRLALLLRNLAYVSRMAEPYVREPAAAQLIAFPKRDSIHYFPGSWRDSGVGYANGRFAMDINVVWVPAALESTGRILEALAEMGFGAAELEERAPEIRGTPLAEYARDPGTLRPAIEAWSGTARHFVVRLSPAEVRSRIEAKLDWLPEEERDYWAGVLERSPPLEGELEFLALSLDSAGRPIPVVNTDPAMRLFVDDLTRDFGGGTLEPETVLRDVRSMLLPYPIGLFVEGLGPLVANDTYASPEVWEAFREDRYHSPYVVWGREVNLVVLGLARQIGAAVDESGEPRDAALEPYVDELRQALEQTLAAVEASGLGHNELWSYRIEDGRLLPVRYGTSSDVQLWNLTDLAVEYELERMPETREVGVGVGR